MTKPTITLDLSNLLRAPGSYHRLCSRHKLNAEQFDKIVLEQHPEMGQYVNYCNSYLLQYGMYPVPSSVVKLKTFAQDVDIPLVLAGYCASQTGTAKEILTDLRIPYFEIFGVVFARNHFYRVFGIKKTKKFEETFDSCNNDIVSTCNKLGIDIRAKYKHVSDETQKRFAEMHKPQSGGRKGVHAEEDPNLSLPEEDYGLDS